MKLTYVGRFGDGVEVSGFGFCKHGESIELPDAIGEGLLKAQPDSWKLAEEKKGKKEDK